jgi:hypothetical protein
MIQKEKKVKMDKNNELNRNWKYGRKHKDYIE